MEKDKALEILVAPISGPLFASQVASIWRLTECNYKPEICFVGSGGGVATFIGMAAYWNPSKLFSVCSSLSTSCFVSEWNTSSLNIFPRKLGSLVHGSMYKSTEIGMKILCNYLSENTAQDIEIWIASINEMTGQVLLSCNKKRESCMISGRYLNVQLFEYEELSYLSGNIEEISKALLASACIPILIEPVNIRGQAYVDCGVKYGSSFTPMFQELLALSRKRDVHITYLSGCDLSNCPDFAKRNGKENIGLFDHLEFASSHAARSHVEYDRNMAYLLLQIDCEEEPSYREFPGTDIDYVLEVRKNASKSLLEIYPEREVKLDLFKFEGEDLRKCILEYSELLKIRLWWTGRADLF